MLEILHQLWSHSFIASLVLPATVGTVAHRTIFKHGEWHRSSSLVFYTHLCIFALIFTFQLSQTHNARPAITDTLSKSSAYLTGLFASITFYRYYWHPLASFPGPRLARISKLWHVIQCWDSRNYLLLERLRGEFGDFVRTGPNEITIFHPDGLKAVNNTQVCGRSDWYDLLYPSLSVNTVRGQGAHDERRKIWVPAFGAQAMQSYERRIRDHTERFARGVSNNISAPIELNTRAYSFTFNIMRDFSFSKSPAQEAEEWDDSLHIMHEGLALLGPLSPMPWVALFAFSFTFIPLVRDFNRMMDFCKQSMRERVQEQEVGRSKIDISHFLIEHAKSKNILNEREHLRWLDGDSFATILAGSDTTAVTIIMTLYFLAKNQHHQNQLRAELSSTQGRWQQNLAVLEPLPFLNAIINEAMRLYHPLPTAGGRQVLTSGLRIGETFIPPGTNVVAPRYSYGRQDTHFEKSHEFVPERWTTRPDMVKNKQAFSPWSRGKWSCLGQAVAMYEMRCLLATLLTRFSFRFRQGDDGSSVIRDLRDRVTAEPGELQLVFEPL